MEVQRTWESQNHFEKNNKFGKFTLPGIHTFQKLLQSTQCDKDRLTVKWNGLKSPK